MHDTRVALESDQGLSPPSTSCVASGMSSGRPDPRTCTCTGTTAPAHSTSAGGSGRDREPRSDLPLREQMCCPVLPRFLHPRPPPLGRSRCHRSEQARGGHGGVAGSGTAPGDDPGLAPGSVLMLCPSRPQSPHQGPPEEQRYTPIYRHSTGGWQRGPAQTHQ